ncbi:M23 family metallopeptidase [Salibacterium halotolerans]|uniref:Stage II sporulation protein Q n=1 Tax=Salibacterium halotolerans TaxID=1884432 RepID=A0A1I5X669_9BACI|nr:M23 family metallopeptidase [Salibacterium halotolerans]SFQ27495.1 stage II sporulation protein Q [Salibacterium halotolerans]
MKNKENQQAAARERRGMKDRLRAWSKQKWFWPAAYLSACAFLLGTYFLIQSPAGTDQAEEEQAPEEEQNAQEDEGTMEGGDSLPAASGDETLQMPVMNEDNVDIIGYYYDHDASAEEQQDSLVYYNNMYYQNKGIDIAGQEGEPFEVTAAATGEVVNVEDDEILGQVVDVKHTDNIVTSYSSLNDVTVSEGDTITQGSVIGTAAKNLYNKDAGVHAHFEVRKNGEPLDPDEAFHQQLTALSSENGNENGNGEEEQTARDDEGDDSDNEEDSSGLEEFPILEGDDNNNNEENAENNG